MSAKRKSDIKEDGKFLHKQRIDYFTDKNKRVVSDREITSCDRRFAMCTGRFINS